MSLKRITLIFITLIAIILSLFQHFEISNETWGYWFFARVFSETGRFIIIQRSPLYILYLNLFSWIGYPSSITLEYVSTSLITVFCLALLFRPYFGTTISVFAALIWIPYMQTSEPPVQKLALALSCLALVARQLKANRFNISLSYALLGFAYMFRPTYLFVLPLFVIYDILKIIRRKKRFLISLKPQPRKDWPLYIVLCLYFIFHLFQSSHPWNTIFFATSTWFPQDAKKEEIIQNYNWSYIERKYGTFVGHDFYFTNKELFNGATNTIDAFKNNPTFIIKQIGIYFQQSIPMITSLTNFPRIYHNFPQEFIFNIILLLLILFGAIMGAKNVSMLLFINGSIIMTLATIVFMPKHRYLIFPFIPIFLLSSSWYSQKLYNLLTKLTKTKSTSPVYFAISFVTLILFSPTFTGINYYNRTYLEWSSLLKNVANDVKKQDLKIMENRSDFYVSSMKASYAQINSLIKNCHGVMSLEYTFLGAYLDIPVNNIYDVWEIPPFGKLGDPIYQGLRPDRINCLFISRELDLYEGHATNYQIRYQNYIKPYREKLLSLGAIEYDLPTYGKIVILK